MLSGIGYVPLPGELETQVADAVNSAVLRNRRITDEY